MTTIKSYQIDDNITIRGTLSANNYSDTNATTTISMGALGSVDSGLTNNGLLMSYNGTQVLHISGEGNAWLKNDLRVNGNLYVAGTQTIVNTQVMQVSDNIMTLNSDVTGSPTENAGIEIERGTEPNTSITWDEGNDWWALNNGVNTYRIVHELYNADLTLISKDAPSLSLIDTNGKSLKITIDNNLVTINNLTSDIATIDLTTGRYSDADKLDGLHNTSFVRTDASSSINSGYTLTINGTLALTGNITANGTTISPAEISYLDNVTSNIQTQLNSKAPTSHAANASTYGYGDTTNAGHLRVGDGIAVSSGTISVRVGTGLQLTGTSPNKQVDVKYGTTSGTACEGNDSRLHTHTRFREKYIAPTGGISQGTAVTIPNSKTYTNNGLYLWIFVDGVFQHLNEDYSEASTSTVTFNYDIPEGSIIEFICLT